MAAFQIYSISQANANHDLAELEKLVLVIFIASTKNPSTKKGVQDLQFHFLDPQQVLFKKHVFHFLNRIKLLSKLKIFTGK